MKNNYPVTQREKPFPDQSCILSTTDLKGIITYVNQDFVDISGFQAEELLRKNHNIVRHPDMPPAAFADLWDTLKEGHSWMGVVKNRCKNGDHYWVDAYVTPITNGGQVVEYQSVRTRPEREIIERAERLYADIHAGKPPQVGFWASLSIRWKLLILQCMAFLPLAWLISRFPGDAAVWLAVGGSFGLALSVCGQTLKPVCRAINLTKSVVDNRLMQMVYTGRTDEVGQLLLAVRKMRAEAAAIIGRIENAAGQLEGVGIELGTSIAHANQGVEHQEREITQLAASLEQMSATIREMASHAATAAGAVEEVDSNSSEGRQVVKDTILGIQQLADNVDRLHQVMGSLVHQAGDISTIVDVIQDISEQTNLLALNAAIEAARAGEQGRGFAVVADEVRTLASRTQNSTLEIQEKIERLQQETQRAAQEIEASKLQAQQGVEQIKRTGMALEGISSAISNINTMNSVVASSTEEQGAAAEEINRNVVTIHNVAEQTADGFKYTSELMDRINKMAVGLRQLTAQFKSSDSMRKARI